MRREVEAAKALLEADGWVVLRAKSYENMKRQKFYAECDARSERQHRVSTERWAREDLLPEERRLRNRCTFLYGLASRLGATDEELRGEAS